MTKQSWLRLLERGLLAAGVVLGVYCAAVLVEARFHNSLPLPAPDQAPVTVTQTAVPGTHSLPGDARDPHAAAPSVPAPAQGTLLGRIDAPSIEMSAPLLEGSDDGTLSHGAGHIEDTPFPGQAGNIALTTADRVYHYTISKTLIVGPDDVYVLDVTEQPTLTLVTCYPFEFIGHAPKRFIVQAQLVGEDARSTPK